MFTCSVCNKEATYLFDNEKFLCYDCIKINTNTTKATKLETYTINNLNLKEVNKKEYKYYEEKIQFILKGNFKISFLNFIYLPNTIFDYLKILDNVQSNNKIVILFFPTRKELVDFTKKFFNKSISEFIESRFTFFQVEEDNYVLFNYDKIKTNELSFLMKYFDVNITLQDNRFSKMQDFEQKCISNYVKTIRKYNKKLGIDFVYTSNIYPKYNDYEISLRELRDDFFTLKLIYQDDEGRVSDYIMRQIQIFGKNSFTKATDQLPLFDGVIHLMILYLRCGIHKSLLKSTKIDEIVKLGIGPYNWEDFSFLEKDLLDLYYCIATKLDNCDSEKEFNQTLFSIIDDFIEKLRSSFYREEELHYFLLSAEEILVNMDSYGDSYLYSPQVVSFLYNTNSILKNNQDNNPMLTYHIYDIREVVLNRFTIYNKNRDIYLSTYIEIEEFIAYIKAHSKFLKKYYKKAVSYNTLVLIYFDLMNLCYIYQDIMNLRKIINNIKEIIDEPDVDIANRIRFLFQVFTTEEDYYSLREIYRLSCIKQNIKKEDNSIKGICYFSEAFFSDSMKTKEELYKKAIGFNEDIDINPLNLYKESAESEFTENLFSMYYNLEKSLHAKNIGETSEYLKKALEIIGIGIATKFTNKNILKIGGHSYFYAKTKILNLILLHKFEDIEKYILEINNNDNKQSMLFSEVVSNTIKVIDLNFSDKLLYVTKLGDTSDIWIKIIKKIITFSGYEDFSKDFDIEFAYSDKSNLIKKENNFSDIIFTTIHDFAFYCRQHSKVLFKLDENSIRDLYLVILKNMFSAEGEAYNYDGKTDFKVTNPNNRYEYITGEFKWWNCEKNIADAFNQAIRKHSCGQEKEVYIIILNKNKDLNSIVPKIEELILNENETICLKNNNITPKGSNEIFKEFLVKNKGNEIPLKLGFIHLYYAKC